tara:strand:+ start:54 stop:1076 length:1023 start_codon:yes stop_codon:yes gene_type:complete
MRSRQLLIIHIIVWSFYFVSLIYYVDIEDFNSAGEENQFFYMVGWCLSRFFDVGCTYFISEIIFNKLLSKGKTVLFIIALSLTCFFHYAYDSVLWNWLNWEVILVGASDQQRYYLIMNGIQTLFIAFIFFASKSWSYSVIRKEELKDEVAQTELKFLKSQMSPHFLFNVFNNIYSLSLDNNFNTHKAISQLKSIMNYIQIFESKSEISLAEEESHLQDYIALNRLRHQAKVRLKSSFCNPNMTIESMIFLPFFENAFKHGKTGEGDEIRASIREKDGVVNFEINNDIDPERRKDSVPGVGLENIKKRLPYLYSEFWMDVIQDDGKYKVKIRIDLGKKVKL